MQVLVTVPSRLLLEQFAEELPSFCKVGMHYNDKIDMEAQGFVAVTRSVHLLEKLHFETVVVDEAHHPPPRGSPSCTDTFKFSATHKEEVDFRYSLGAAIEQGVLSDYDMVVPVTIQGHPYICLANFLLSQAGHFRRVLAYCNSIAEARRFRKVLETVGLATWHIHARTSRKIRARVMREFAGDLQKPVHVLVTVQVLGEGVNIPNADTCMFVEPRGSYVSIIQAIGRVLRLHPSKPVAHVVLPAIAIPGVPETSMTRLSLGSTSGTSASVAQVLPTESPLEPLEMDASSHMLAAAGATAGNGSRIVGLAEHRTQSCRGCQAADRPEEGRSDGVGCAQPNDGDNAQGSNLHGSSQGANFKHSHTRKSRRQCGSQCSQETTAEGGNGAELHNRCGKQSSPVGTVPLTPSIEDVGAVPIGSDSEELQGVSATASEAESGTSPGISTFAISRFQAEEVPKQLRLLRLGHSPEAVVSKVSQSARSEVSQEPEEDQEVVPHRRSATSKLLVNSLGETPSGRGCAEQLDRFLEVIARADSRFVEKDIRHLQSRLRVMDCRLQQETMPQLLVRNVQLKLASILQQRDAWDMRLQAVERFDQDHGRLPRAQSFGLEERTLGMWVQQVGVYVKKGVLSALRMQKVLSSSCMRLRARTAKWLGSGVFERRLNDLRQFVDVHHRMPVLSSRRPRDESVLAARLASLVAPARRARERRLQILEKEGPIIAKWAKSRQGRRVDVREARWRSQFDRLLELVASTDRLPRPLLKEEHKIHTWLCKQRRILKFLPAKLRAALFDSHPAVASFLKG